MVSKANVAKRDLSASLPERATHRNGLLKGWRVLFMNRNEAAP
jgi:hypothetical protein